MKLATLQHQQSRRPAVDTPPEAIKELEAGRVQGVVDNGLQLRYRLKKENLTTLRVIDNYDPILVGQLAFAVREYIRYF